MTRYLYPNRHRAHHGNCQPCEFVYELAPHCQIDRLLDCSFQIPPGRITRYRGWALCQYFKPSTLERFAQLSSIFPTPGPEVALDLSRFR